MDYIRVTGDNIAKEHICCAISNNNDVQVTSKKAWLKERFEDGLVFLKSTERGYVLYYTSQCPFNAKYVPVIEALAKERSVTFRAVHLQSREEAQNAPTPVTTYALFLDGSYLTNEQMNDKRFLKLLEKEGALQ